MKLNFWNRLFHRRALIQNKPATRSLRFRPQVTQLEDRVVPATISLAGGSLTYSGTDVTNTLDFSLAGGTYTFKNLVDEFTGVAPAGVTYSDSDMSGGFDTATVANGIVTQLTINLGTFNNTVNLGDFDAAIDPLAITGGGNAVSTLTVKATGTGITTTGDVSFTGFNSISVLNLITAANVTLQADQMTISQPINVLTGTIDLSTTTASRPIQLGAASSGAHLGFTQAQLNNLTAGLLAVGNATTGGDISVVANITFNPANIATLALRSAGSISGPNTLTVNNLAFTSTGNVTLSGTWNTVAGTSGGSVSLTNSQSLTVDSVNGIDLLSAATNLTVNVNGANNLLTVNKPVSSATGDITLQSDRQTLASTVTATGHRVTLQPLTAARLISVGGADSATTLGFLEAELNQVTAATLQLGRTTSGNITVAADVAPTGIAALSLITAGSISGAHTITVDQLRFSAAAGPVSLNGGWNTVAGVSGAAVTLTNDKNLTIGTIDSVAGVQAGAALSVTVTGSLTVANNVSSTTASAVTLTTVDLATAGQDITVNTGVSVSSVGGNVTLNAGDNITVASGATLQSVGAGQLFLRIDFTTADAVGGILQSTGATLSAPAGASMIGFAHSDQFFVSSSSNTAMGIDGGAGSNSLQFDGSGLAVTINGATLTATGRQPVTFAGITPGPINLVNTASVTMQGTAGADGLTLFGTVTGVEASLNGGIHFAFGNVPFTFNGLGGINTVTFDYLNGNASPTGGATFNGVADYTVLGSDGDDTLELTSPGATIGFTFNTNPFVLLPGITHFTFNGRLGNDLMKVVDTGNDPVPATGIDYDGGGDFDTLFVNAPGRTGSYTPSGTLPAFGFDGNVTVQGKSIDFTSLSPVDITGFASFTATFPKADDLITLEKNFAFSLPTQDAIRMSGTSGGTGFETLAIWNVTNFTVDTTTVDGFDTITVKDTGLRGDHDVTNISLITGDNDDTITASGPVDLAGDLLFSVGSSNDTINITGNMGVGGNLTILTGDGTNIVTQSASTTTTVTGNVLVTAGINVDTITASGSFIVSGSLTVNLGADDDALSLFTTAVTGAINLNGQGGTDVVSITGVTSGSSVTITSETINITANLTANTTTTQLLLVDQLNVAGVTVSGNTGVTQTAAALATNVITLTGTGLATTSTFNSASGPITFDSNINGTTANIQQLAVNARNDITLQNIGNLVRLGSLNVNSAAGNILLTRSTYNAGPQTYTTLTTQSTIVNTAAVTFDGAAGDVTFNSRLNGTVAGFTAVTVNTTGNTNFNQKVGDAFALKSLTTNVGGTTHIDGSAVTTFDDQNYQDDVILNAALTTLKTTNNGSITFGQTLNVGANHQDLTLETGTGAIAFNGNVGNGANAIRDIVITSAGNVTVGATTANTFTASGFKQVAGTGTTTFNAATNINNACPSLLPIIADVTNNGIILNNNFTSAQDIRFNANTSGVTQTAVGVLTTQRLIFAGTGFFDLNQLGNTVAVDFQANVNGDILLAAKSLTISQTGVTTSNDDVTFRTGGNFKATPTAAGGQLISIGTGDFQLFHGLTGSSIVEFKTEIVAATVNLGAPPATPVANQNNNQDSYIVRPSANVKILVWGNAPHNNFIAALNDDLTLDLSDLAANETVNLTSSEIVPGSGSYKGTFSFTNGTRKDLDFHSIENFGDFRLVATVFQTTTESSEIILGAKLSDRNINFKMPKVNIPPITFIVNPRLVNPKAPYSAPRIVMGDVNGDGFDDLVLGGGSNRSSVVIAIDGKKLTENAFSGSTLDGVATLPRSYFLAQFLAYESSFMGGVFIAVGKLDPTSTTSQIIVGPGAGRAPEVRVFNFDASATPANAIQSYPNNASDMSFYAYESSFKGGVRVAIRNTGGIENQIVTAPGAGRAAQIRLFNPSSIPVRAVPMPSTPSSPVPAFSYLPYADISPAFKGGLFLATGDYDNDLDLQDDILVGPGTGLKSRVRVFNGATSTKIVDFEAYGPDKSTGVIQTTTVQNTGVGGVSFARDTSGKLGILVGSAPGTLSQVRFFAPVAAGAPFSTNVAATPNIYTILHTGTITGGTWGMVIDGKNVPGLLGLSANITAGVLQAKLVAAGYTTATVAGDLASAFVITFEPVLGIKYMPNIVFKNNLTGATFKPVLGGIFSSSTRLLKDYLGNYFRYDALLVTELATNRYRDGTLSVVATK